MMIIQFSKTIAVAAETNKVTPSAAKAGKMTIIIKAEKGNYALYLKDSEKLNLVQPKNGKLNVDGKGLEYEVTLTVTKKDKKNELHIAEGGTLFFVRVNAAPGSFTLCKMQLTVNKENIIEFRTVETMTGRMFINDHDKVVVPVLASTPLETLLAQVSKQANVSKLEHEDAYNTTKAGAGLTDRAGIVTNFDPLKDVVSILTRDSNKMPVSVKVPWNNIVQTQDLKDPNYGTAVLYKNLIEGKSPALSGPCLLEEATS